MFSWIHVFHVFTFSRFSRFHRFKLSLPPCPFFPLRPIQNIARDQGLVPMFIFYLTTCACKSCCKSWRQLEPIYPHVTWPTGNMYVLYNICIDLYAYTYRKSSIVETYILTYIHTWIPWCTIKIVHWLKFTVLTATGICSSYQRLKWHKHSVTRSKNKHVKWG